MIDKNFISIGILCSKRDNLIHNLINRIFTRSGYKLVYNNGIKILSFKDKSVLIMELSPKTIKNAHDLGLSFDIIIQNMLNKEDYENPLIKEMVAKAKHIILNIDDENSTKILERDIEGLIITYGINKKATITASSLSDINKIEFNICLQREYEAIDGQKIEPMEEPIILNPIKGLNIYHGLGSIACGLSYGMSIEQMKKSLL